MFLVLFNLDIARGTEHARFHKLLCMKSRMKRHLRVHRCTHRSLTSAAGARWIAVEIVVCKEVCRQAGGAEWNNGGVDKAINHWLRKVWDQEHGVDYLIFEPYSRVLAAHKRPHATQVAISCWFEKWVGFVCKVGTQQGMLVRLNYPPAGAARIQLPALISHPTQYNAAPP